MVICFWSKLVLQGNTQETRLYLVIRNEIRIHNCDNWQWFLNYRSDVESSYLQQSRLMKSNNKVVSTCRICVWINYWLLFYWRRRNYFRYSGVKQNRIVVPRKISTMPNINGCFQKAENHLAMMQPRLIFKSWQHIWSIASIFCDAKITKSKKFQGAFF